MTQTLLALAACAVMSAQAAAHGTLLFGRHNRSREVHRRNASTSGVWMEGAGLD
jgi:hypothetical protein